MIHARPPRRVGAAEPSDCRDVVVPVADAKYAAGSHRRTRSLIGPLTSKGIRQAPWSEVIRSTPFSSPMAKLAIIGTGIAGLGCAHFLHRHFDLTLFEQNDYIGGHTNTITVPEKDTGRPLPIDTGFMVYNEVTYPLLTRLFAQLRVPV